MEVLEKTGSELLTYAHWFGRDIEDDPWIVFHATTSVSESVIDESGFISAAGLGYRNIVEKILSFVKNTGLHLDDPALCSFTATRFSIRNDDDFGKFFALYPQRVFWYLRKSMCGGEVVSVLLNAIRKISEICENWEEVERRVAQKKRV